MVRLGSYHWQSQAKLIFSLVEVKVSLILMMKFQLHSGQKCLLWVACLWSKMSIFQRAGLRKGGLSIPQLFNIRFELTHGTQITICVITHNCILNMFVNMYCSTKKLTAGLIYNDFGCDILTLQDLFMMIVLLSNNKE